MSATSFETHARPKPLRSAIGRSFGKWLALCLIGIPVLLFGGLSLARFLRNSLPFTERTVDRTQPAILQAITTVRDFRAASATFDVTVDIEKDAKWLPAAIRGEHKVLAARGSVDAGVDLSHLDTTAVVVDPTTNAVTVTLPHAKLRKADLDLRATKLVVNDRGVLDRLGSVFGGAPVGEQPMLEIAQKKLEVAGQRSDVLRQAERNTETMIAAMIKGLGHSNVTVKFEPVATAAKPATKTKMEA